MRLSSRVRGSPVGRRGKGVWWVASVAGDWGACTYMCGIEESIRFERNGIKSIDRVSLSVSVCASAPNYHIIHSY